MRSTTADDRGSVTAEFATAIPAVLVVLACCLAGFQVAGQQLRLQDAAAGAARALSRGDDPGAVLGGSGLTVSRRGALVCARLSDRAGVLPGSIVRIRLTATSCALAEGP
jgi:hypothetical protein